MKYKNHRGNPPNPPKPAKNPPIMEATHQTRQFGQNKFGKKIFKKFQK